MAGAMGSTAKTMSAMNQQLKVEDIQKTMMNFEKESTKMDMAGEMSEWNCPIWNVGPPILSHLEYRLTHAVWAVPFGMWVDSCCMGLSHLEYRLTCAMWAVPFGI